MEYALHVAVALVVDVVVEGQGVLVGLVSPFLVEDAEHLVQPVVYLSVQARNLHDDAVVYQTLHERVGHALRHQLVVIVIRLVAHIDDRLFDVAQRMSQQVYRDHGQRMLVYAFLHDVSRILILCAQVLSEAQYLCG